MRNTSSRPYNSPSASQLLEPAPILVLGLGNMRLSEVGIGPALLDRLGDVANRLTDSVEFIDGETQGLTLLGLLAGRRALILVDTMTTGTSPGTVHRMTLKELRGFTPARAASGRAGGAVQLLTAAQSRDELPDRLFVVHVEPHSVSTGVSTLTKEVLPAACDQVACLLSQLC